MRPKHARINRSSKQKPIRTRLKERKKNGREKNVFVHKNDTNKQVPNAFRGSELADGHLRTGDAIANNVSINKLYFFSMYRMYKMCNVSPCHIVTPHIDIASENSRHRIANNLHSIRRLEMLAAKTKNGMNLRISVKVFAGNSPRVMWRVRHREKCAATTRARFNLRAHTTVMENPHRSLLFLDQCADKPSKK